MTTILLARHGETDWNRERRFQGHADPPLNRTGRAQAVDLSVTLMAEELAAIYSSPLRRALETAEVVAASHGLEAVPVRALREVDVGSWSGLTRAEVEERFPAQFARWLDYGEGWEDGESYDQMGDASSRRCSRSPPRTTANASWRSPTAVRSGRHSRPPTARPMRRRAAQDLRSATRSSRTSSSRTGRCAVLN